MKPKTITNVGFELGFKVQKYQSGTIFCHHAFTLSDCIFPSLAAAFQGMVIAETKRQMHETLEMKEEEIAQLRSRLQQATTQKEELQEQKEKAEKSGQRN